MKRGPKPRGQVKLIWTSKFAYAIGLLTADGCLSKDARHIDFTSKDKVLVTLFKNCLGLRNKIGKKYSGAGNLSYSIQFGDVLFYNFLLSIGLSPAKSKTIKYVKVPDHLFVHFLRGYFDGDGCSYSFYDSVFPKSYRFYVSFISASPTFVHWLREKINQMTTLRGHLSYYSASDYIQLRFAKKEAIVMAKYLYRKKSNLYLKRKYLKIQRTMSIITKRAAVVKLVDTLRSERSSRKGLGVRVSPAAHES